MDGVKVFSSTMAKNRECLGERVTHWIRHNNDKKIIDRVVLQSSDAAFHCTTIVLFYVLR